MASQKYKRDIGLDFITGIFILHMIWVHILQLTKVDTHGHLYQSTQYLFFFMPWFFYKSGMFYKRMSNKQILIGGGKRLLKPLLLFSILGYVLDVGSLYLKGKISIENLVIEPLSHFVHYGCVNGNAPLWFLTNLFLVRFIYNLLFLTRNIVTASALLMTIILHYMDWNYPLNCGGFMAGLFFYSLGYLLRSKQYGNWQLILSASVYLGSIIMGIQRVSIFRNSLEQGEHYWVFYIQSIAAIIMVNNIAKRLRIGKGNILCSIGKDSMSYYVTHWPIILIVITILKMTGFNNQTMSIMIIVCILILVLPLLNNIIKNMKFV